MPATADSRNVGELLPCSTQHLQRIADRGARKYGHTEAQRPVEFRKHCRDRIIFQAAIDDSHLELRAIEARAHGHQPERHRVKDRSRVIQHNLPASVTGHGIRSP